MDWKLPDWWEMLPDTNNYLKRMRKWDDMKFFPNVVNNDWWWNIWFKFWDFHFSVQLAWSPKPVLHDFFVEAWLDHEQADIILEQLRIAMCMEKTVEWSWWNKMKRTAIKVIARRLYDEWDLS